MDVYISSISDSAYLEHYGVLGMKWGHRKDRVSKRQERRNERAQDYRDQAEGYLKGVNRTLDKNTRKAEARVAYAKSKGSSAKKISKLERKASDARVKSEIVKNRNADMVNRNVEWKQKSVGKKLTDRQTWNSGANYRRASKKAINDAKEKYGKEQVNRIVRKDEAKTYAKVAAMAAAYGGINYALWKARH